jgi:hypothetical protein
MVEARVGCVEDAEAVSPRFDLEKRHDVAVDTVHIAIEFLNPNGVLFGSVDDPGVVKRAIVMEEAILQHERDLKLALWKVERPLRFVTNNVEACETGVDVQPGDAEAVIVIPERGGGLAVWVRGWVRVEFGSVFTICGEPGLGVSVVFRENTGPVKMRNVANCGERCLGAAY